MRVNVPVWVMAFASAAWAQGWRPIDPAQMALSKPAIDPQADAEVLYWEVRIEDRVQPPDIWVIYTHHLRTKIFTEKGAKDQGTVEIPYFSRTTISDLAARTIQPDGTIVELRKEDIRESDVYKGKKRAGRKVKSLAFPAVKPGSIIEYRFRETRTGELASHVALEFSRELPVHEVKYMIKPLQLEWLPYRMRNMDFNLQRKPFTMEPHGTISYAVTSARNIPAFKPEPHMPPGQDVRPWMLIYYEEDKKLTPDKYWKEVGKDNYKLFAQTSKMEGPVKKMAAELVTGLNTQEEKVEAIQTFCRTKIKNLFGPEVTAAQREKFKGNRDSGDTLKNMMGHGDDIAALFAALVNAAGFEARKAMVADRSRKFFVPQMMSARFLHTYNIAVKYPDGWKFYDPSTQYLPKGMLRWQEEASAALVTDDKNPELVPTPLSPPARTRVSRRADLELEADGTVEGTLRIGYTGHLATDRRNEIDEETEEERRETIKQELAAQFEGAELTEVKVENVKEVDKPLVYAAKIRMPGYAQRTGKRLFLQPAFFHKNSTPRFAASERKWDIQFDYPWSEADRVTILLPEGLELDQPTAPQSVKIGETGEYKAGLALSQDRKQLVYTREFEWGRQEQIIFPVKGYPVIKRAFDFVNEQDTHTVALKASK